MQHELQCGPLTNVLRKNNGCRLRSARLALQVAGELEGQHTNPIAADAFVLDTMLEKAFDCAQEVKSKQMSLTAEQEKRDAEAETAFFAGILFQRDQVRYGTYTLYK